MQSNNPDKEFWCGKRVLVTGHTGFKGSWLAIWLDQLGAKVCGISLKPNTAPNLFDLAEVSGDVAHSICDIRDAEKLAVTVSNFKPEIVFHLAAQALVRPSYADPLETFSSNTMGTANLLDAVRRVDSVNACVVVTTDKVYNNEETGRHFYEDDKLGGHDPYSASKAAAELVVSSYRSAFLANKNVGVASARAGNAIGGGDWSDERLIPDAVKSWQRGEVLQIRRPGAIRPWQHLLDPLCGYLKLAESIWHSPENATAFNFGPDPEDSHSVKSIIETACAAFGRGEVEFAEAKTGPHEAHLLSLNNAKAKTKLGVSPKWTTETAVLKTMNWYKAFYAGQNARSLCLNDIRAFEETA